MANTDIIYKAIAFYLEEHPLETRDLLSSIASKVHRISLYLILMLSFMAT